MRGLRRPVARHYALHVGVLVSDTDPVIAPLRQRRTRILGATPAACPPPRKSRTGMRTRPAVSRDNLTETHRVVLEALADVAQPAPAASLTMLTGLRVGVIRRALGDMRELQLVELDYRDRNSVWSVIA